MSDGQDKPATSTPEAADPPEATSVDRPAEGAPTASPPEPPTEDPQDASTEPVPEPAAAAEQPAAASADPAAPAAEERDPSSTPDGADAEDKTGSKAAGEKTAVEPARRKPKFPALVRAFRSARSIEGQVEQVIKGGYQVRIGRARGFCPHSQIDLHRENEPERQVGKTYSFKITQLRRGGEDIVLSRRAVLEDERTDEAKAVRATLIEGAVMLGHVVGTAAFGAFVDLGAGVQGLVHISELSHRRVKNVEDAVKVGDAVRVRILKLKDSGRISLSIRRAEDDPWADVASRFEVGHVYAGTVRRLADFGAFVELSPGVEALAPASEFPPLSAGWRDELEVGSSGDWHVLSVDAKARRISVTPPGDAPSPADLKVGAEVNGQVQRVERYGVFLWLGPGRVGLMPRVMTGAPEGADLRRNFRIGDRVDVQIVGIEDGGRRIRLCKKGVEPRDDREERPATRADMAQGSEEPVSSFGTSLADKLRAALERGGGS